MTRCGSSSCCQTCQRRPEALADHISVIDLPLPDTDTLKTEVIDYLLESARESGEDIPALPAELEHRTAERLLGMSADESARVASLAYVAAGGFNDKALEIIAEEKVKVIRKIEGLSYVPYARIASAADVGGFDLYLDFVRTRSHAFTEEAAQAGLERPRGVALVGFPGTGKTMVAKATARVLGLDLITMDIGTMFDSLVGSSERRMRSALNVVTAMQNCVLLVDEIDKAMQGAHQAQGDSGVSSRILSYFLGWLSEREQGAKQNRTFVIVTMNRTEGMPPEMLCGPADSIACSAPICRQKSSGPRSSVSICGNAVPT